MNETDSTQNINTHRHLLDKWIKHTHTHTIFWLVMCLHAQLEHKHFSDELAVHSELAPLLCPTSIVGLDQCGLLQHQRRLAGPHQGFFQLLAQHLKRVQFSVHRSKLLSAANDTDASEQNHSHTAASSS